MSSANSASILAGTGMHPIVAEMSGVSTHVSSQEASLTGQLDRVRANIADFKHQYVFDPEN